MGSYAQALYDLAKEENLQTQFLEELETLRGVFESESDFLRLLCVPDLSKQERCQLPWEGTSICTELFESVDRKRLCPAVF